jgi:ubiquinone/menaquinone biosynthesis C-methylase UbiE
MSVEFVNEILEEITQNMYGVEIGGPSGNGKIIYKSTCNLDNVVFADSTVWANNVGSYNFYQGKSGKNIINDAVNIDSVNDSTYDYLFASHCLEHIANPLKALKEWLRITKPDGHIILVLPEKSVCFDHKRQVSSFSTILSQYEKNVGEDDLSTLPEILANHDLSMDPQAGTYDQFKERSLKNFENRCLHHYVYSPELLNEMCEFLKCEFIYSLTDGLNMWFIMEKKQFL